MEYFYEFNTFNSMNKMLNEGLIKTLSLKKTIETCKHFFRVLSAELEIKNINEENNTFELEISYVNNLLHIKQILSVIDSTIVNIAGYFPSYVTIENIMGSKKEFKWNDNSYLDIISNRKNYRIVTIRFESKFDEIIKIDSEYVYHLTNKSYLDKILKNGLVPKSKNKLSFHPDRIYLTDNIIDAKKLETIFRSLVWEEQFDNKKNKKSEDFILLEIENKDLTYRKDPNYETGFYTTDNIHPKNITVKKETNQ